MWRERIILANPDADALLEAALMTTMAATTPPDAVQSVPIAARDDRPPLVLHVIPVRGAAHDIFSHAAALMVVTPVNRRAVPTAAVLQGLFDLTPAEARVAGAIAKGDTLADLAAASGLSRETVRTQLKAVLAKTGVGRQADLTALLTEAVLPGRSGD